MGRINIEIENDSELSAKCRTCNRIVPLYLFITCNSRPNGKGSRCKRCHFIYQYKKKNFQGNIEKTVDAILAKQAFLRAFPHFRHCTTGDHFAPTIQFKTVYKSTCKDCFDFYYREKSSEYFKKRYRQNNNFFKEKATAYRQANPEKVSQLKKEIYRKKKDIYSARAKNYRLKNQTKIQQNRKIHYQANKLQYKINARNRVARKRTAKGNYTKQQWLEKLSFFNYCCYLCGQSLGGKQIHAEHRVPLIRGGTNWISNIAPACAKCNLSKGTYTEKEYREKIKGSFL